MRMQLLSYREVPPDGYRWTCSQTGVQIRNWDAVEWVGKAKRHLQSNNLPVPIDLQAQMEDQLCQLLPPGWCAYDDPNRPRVDTRLSWVDVEVASKTFIDWAEQGRPLVDQPEAERRANICARCYMNVRAQGCGKSCRALIRKLTGLFLNRKTSVDDQLNTCAACKCDMRVKCHFSLDLIESNDSRDLQQLYPDFCWLKQGGMNYDPS